MGALFELLKSLLESDELKEELLHSLVGLRDLSISH